MQHHFRTIRKFAPTGGTLLIGNVIFLHFPAAKFARDVDGSLLEDRYSCLLLRHWCLRPGSSCVVLILFYLYVSLGWTFLPKPSCSMYTNCWFIAYIVVVWDLSEFFFSSWFLILITFFIVFVIYEICVRERDGRVRRRKRAQTTHRHEVWLQVTFFISLFNIYVLLHATFNLQNERWEAATTRKSLGGCFFFPCAQF